MRYAALTAGLAAVLAVVGCARAAEPVEPGADPGPLRGRTFTATVLPDRDAPRAVVAGTSIRLQFTDDGRLVANAGCNTMSGPVDVAGGTLDAADLSITEMACDPPRHEQDRLLSTFLSGKPSWRLDGEQLVLSSPGAELTLTEEKAPPLVGPTWKLDTLIRGEVAGSTPVDVTLVFGPDEVTVSGLCNLRAVKYRSSGSTINFELGPMTLMACSPEIMTVEQAAVDLLDGEATYRIDAGTLTITKGDKGFRFVAEV
ncbi:MAG TPA: META domain-containing protein [Actinophytocola sp.]|uniref:META domain-containing protein n=1 Tax=Actinophytocola sp. TaxID=1872138 RepID=UPI002DDD6248|nr:META domain-containing protein [Actinophytocola sp.]HEV2782271.1 META domain-containing protein [Actinophytocola sp.]